MDRKKEEMFKRFEGNLKILSIRAKYTGDEKAGEYQEIVKKLERIRENRHLAMVGEENEESIMYLQLLDVIGGADQNNEEALYGSVKQLLSNYNTNERKSKNELDIGEER